MILVLLLLLLMPPRPSTPPGQYRCQLLPNMAQCRIQLLIAHPLLTQVIISLTNSTTNHIIGIRRTSLLVLLLVCNDLFLICWPQRRSCNRWQNLRVKHPSIPWHISILKPSWYISCRLTPTFFLNGVRMKVNERLWNVRSPHRKNICRRSRDVMHVSVLLFNSLKQVVVHLLNPAHDPT